MKMVKLLLAVLCVICLLVLAGCGLCGGGEPVLNLRSPVSIGMAVPQAQIPPENQTAVFAAPVRAQAAAPAAAYCPPVDEPLYATRSYQRDK